ncbi:hypothetical protein [Streptomyces stelliscabiei]|uniref:hypothetical protein n=1 Tax=Streptomyces stelliscabiei TaxID=146820 RepID=UPI002FF2571E
MTCTYAGHGYAKTASTAALPRAPAPLAVRAARPELYRVLAEIGAGGLLGMLLVHGCNAGHSSEQLEASKSVFSPARWLGHSDSGFTLRPGR